MSTQRRSYGFGTPDPSQMSFPQIPPHSGKLTTISEDGKSHRIPPRLTSIRIWVFVIFSSHVGEYHHLSYPNSNLIPKDYLNTTEDTPPPFDFCPIYGPGDVLAQKYGAHTLLKSKLHLGSGARVQKVIRKALSGLPVTISVLGGSISACHGAGNDPISPACYPSRFFQWWNEVFPHPASELTNGAVRRTNSAYFSFCHSHHIPDQSDLVILDFDTDDPNEPEWMEYFELLVRSILIRPDSPAVVILGHFSPQLQTAHGFTGPEILHTVVAQYYDVPHISIKPALYSQRLASPGSIDQYFVDPILANPAGHELIADILISYFQSQICIGWASATGTGFEVPTFPMGQSRGPPDSKGLLAGVGIRKGSPMEGGGLEKDQREDDNSKEAPFTSEFLPFRVPPVKMNMRPHELADFREVKPWCVSANDLINPLPPSLFYGSGWHSYHPPKSATAGTNMHYWYSTLPTSRLRVPMKMSSGDVAVYYWREEEGMESLSGVKCWVDDNVGGAVEIWNQDGSASGPTLKMIDHFVAAGSHFVQCELLGEEGRGVTPFKILGIFST
ncbi:hypothetical protein Clacol_008972 [Clathrus columnatus]|uniref:Cap64 protein n=1 Tax=Clathrus columnatus TaxID=1419009 RepID=A0AAV5APE4_9AGAM|nr:hypothetical protein Clacol_008972 [Clathrus columnatus]